MSPISPLHASCVHRVFLWLSRVCGDANVRMQQPLVIGDSEPEPDIAVVPGKLEDHRDSHLATALQVVEVAQTSAEYDRRVKAPLYAGTGIPEYWIVNLDEGCAEVYRDPAPLGESYAYHSRRVYVQGEHLTPLQKPEVTVRWRSCYSPKKPSIVSSAAQMIAWRVPKGKVSGWFGTVVRRLVCGW